MTGSAYTMSIQIKVYPTFKFVFWVFSLRMHDKFDSGNDKFDSYVRFRKTYLQYQE